MQEKGLMIECDAIQERLVAYALVAQDPDEQGVVQRHLEDFPQCQRRLEEYREVAATLPEALAAVSRRSLRADIKTRLLQRVQEINSPPVSATDPSVTDIARRRGRVDRSRSRLVPALLGLLLVICMAWAIRTSVVLARERALRAEYASLVDQQELVLEVVDSNQTVRRVLLPPLQDSRAYGKLFSRADMLYGVAMAARLPTPPSGQAYHLLVTRADRMELAGVRTVNEEVFGLLLFQVEQENPDYDAAQLTLLPQGSTAPSGAPLIAWPALE